MADIFISYAREDESRIRELVRSIEGYGWSIFWDRRIPAGKTWEGHIGKALNDAKYVIVAWSQFSIISEWVKDEAREAKMRNRLIPVLLDPVIPPMGFRGIQAADLTGWKPGYPSPHFDELIQDIAEVMGGMPHQLAHEEEQRRKTEGEAKRQAEAVERQKAEAEAKRKAEEEERQRVEEEAKRQAEAAERQKAEAEAKRKAEEEQLRKAEEEATRRMQEEQQQIVVGAEHGNKKKTPGSRPASILIWIFGIAVLIIALFYATPPKSTKPTQPAPAHAPERESSPALAPAPTQDMVKAFRTGEEYEEHKNYAEAVKCYRMAAEQGYAPAQDKLGLMYEEERGVKRNYHEAFEWYQKAADQGHSGGQANLGSMYVRGRGVNQNYDDAVKWFRMAADQGNAVGQNWLGIMYENGRGVKKSYDKAAQWYQKAADQGHAYAQKNLGTLYYYGRGVEQSDTVAIKWIRKAADQGLASAQSWLGRMYKEGRGVDENDAEAVNWYRKAAKQGDNDAQKELLRRHVTW